MILANTHTNKVANVRLGGIQQVTEATCRRFMSSHATITPRSSRCNTVDAT
jgi:hypothetical protein